MRTPPTSLLTTAGLAGGFAIARATRKRPLGGVIWALAGACCLPRWRKAGWLRASLLGATYTGALGGSHPLAKKVGGWPAVAIVSAVTGVLATLLADRR